jgi:hypothetical protein
MHPRDAILSLIDLLTLIAENAPQIARAKRELYNAYIAEGFNELQSLELVRNASGIPGGL